MNAVIATDLDRTLIFSPRAIAELGGPLPAQVVETVGGRPVSMLAVEVAAALAALPGEIVPTTTRTVEQLARVRLPVRFQFAIAACGAVVLEDGQPDPGWARSIADRTRDSAPVEAAAALLRRHPAVLRSYCADAFAYGIVGPGFSGGDLDAQARSAGWRVARNGRKLYLLPAGLHKAQAVSYVAARLGADRVLAAGDSLLDRELLLRADVAWVPRGSELVADPPAHARITAEPGHRAAREIVAGWRAELAEQARCRA